ncbi:hypothetical protein CAY62_07370 [Photobacterium damselae subsp. damselae]|nr:hypothetical protein CAY62_07370 [Photobacterium damselae subsp. damselae]
MKTGNNHFDNENKVVTLLFVFVNPPLCDIHFPQFAEYIKTRVVKSGQISGIFLPNLLINWK